MADWTLVFGVGAPAPQYVPAPHDAGLAQRVEKAAVYVHKNGPEFHVREKYVHLACPER